MRKSPLIRKTPLRAKTQLKSQKPINKISAKQKVKNKQQEEVKQQLIEQMLEKDGYLHCSNCGRNFDFRGGAPHHKIFKSHGGENSVENENILCGFCHSQFHHIKEVR